MHIYIMPTMNPDGYDNRERDNSGGYGYDLNRNFPDQYRDAGSDLRAPVSDAQPETIAVVGGAVGGVHAVGGGWGSVVCM